jgi:aspartate/methionine/tyrosine aminotransferase
VLHGPDAELYAYGATVGTAALRGALARRAVELGRAHDVDPDRNVLVGVGATHALSCAIRAVVAPGDAVTLFAPYWPLAHGILASAGARVDELAWFGEARERTVDARALGAAIPEGTRALYLITPNNPDGRVLTRAELTAVAEVAVARDLWVVADEVYADYLYDGREHVSIATLPGMAERTITAFSFSKSHALAGARVGWVVAPEAVVGHARRLAVHTVFNVPVVAQRAALAALADDAWVTRARATYDHARGRAVERLARTKLRFSVPEGGVYVFADFAPVLDGRTLPELLTRAIGEGALVAPGDAFGERFATWARICFTSAPLAEVERGLDALVRAF